MADDIVELDLGVRPEASGAVCLQTERATFLTFNAVRPTGRQSQYGEFMDDAGTAVVEFKLCLVSRFGYPNDEARWGIPQYKDLSYGIYEIKHSSWVEEIIRLNKFRFANTSEGWIRKKRHFLFTFHDDTFECLADDLKLEVVNEPYDITFQRIRSYAFGERPG